MVEEIKNPRVVGLEAFQAHAATVYQMSAKAAETNSVDFAAFYQALQNTPHEAPVIIQDNADVAGAYLLVSSRKDWLLAVCSKVGVLPRILFSPPVTYYDPSESGGENRTDYVKAYVTLNGIVVAEGGGTASSLAYPLKSVENAETAAKGRALSNLGFSLPNEALPKYEMDGANIQMAADAPVRMAAPMNPNGAAYSAPGPQMGAPMQPAYGMAAPNLGAMPAPAAPVPAPGNPWDDPARVQAAMAYVVPVGKNKGKTVADLAATDQDALLFYANLKEGKPFNSWERHKEFCEACKVAFYYGNPDKRPM